MDVKYYMIQYSYYNDIRNSTLCVKNELCKISFYFIFKQKIYLLIFEYVDKRDLFK